MRQRRRPLLWAVLAALALSTACEADASPGGGAASDPATSTQPSGGEPSPSLDEQGARIAWPDGTAVDLGFLDVPTPEGASEAQVDIVRSIDYDARIGPVPSIRAISPNGVALLDFIDPAAFDMETWTLNATTPVSLWTDKGTEELGDTTTFIPGDPHRQVISGGFVGDSVTWKETASINMFTSDWRMFRRDLDGGDIELLARSEQVHPDGGLPRAVGGPALTASGDRVAWHTSYLRDDGSWRTKLVSVPGAGGELRDEADLVAMPEGVTDGWVVLRMIDRTVAGAETGWEIQDPNAVASIDLVEPGGEVRVLVEFPGGTGAEWGVSQIAAGGGEVYAWSASDGDVYVSSVEGVEVLRLRQPAGMHVVPHSLAVCDERVVWSAADIEEEAPAITYVFDPADGQITRLPSEHSLGNAVCGGPYIAWTEVSVDDFDAQTAILVRQ